MSGMYACVSASLFGLRKCVLLYKTIQTIKMIVMYYFCTPLIVLIVFVVCDTLYLVLFSAL